MFIPAGCDGYDGLVATLEARNLLASEAEISKKHAEQLAIVAGETLNATFRPGDREQAAAMLGRRPDTQEPRMQLALLKLSKGDLAELDSWCQQAAVDYRDVLFAAWYYRPKPCADSGR